jgi:hypothetical protein
MNARPGLHRPVRQSLAHLSDLGSRAVNSCTALCLRWEEVEWQLLKAATRYVNIYERHNRAFLGFGSPMQDEGYRLKR